MMRGRVLCILLLFIGCALLAQNKATKNLSITATAPPPPTGNLLTGCTPDNLRGTCSMPAGWTLLMKENFDTTTPVCGQAGEFCGYGSVDTAQHHTGTHSLNGFLNFQWGVSLPTDHSEAYVSYYAWRPSNGVQNDELWAGQFNVQNPFQEVVLAWLNTPGGAFNASSGNFSITPQGLFYAGNIGQKTLSVGFGAGWEQWEYHYRANTTGCSGGCADGAFEVWRNGVQIENIQNAKLNGTRDMGGMYAKVGGTYTKLVWLKNCHTTAACQALIAASGPFVCGANIGDGYGVNPVSPYTTTNQPCNIQVPGFTSYVDDIIVLYK